jgi:hypothetical protein
MEDARKGIVVPGVEPVTLELGPARLTRYGRGLMAALGHPHFAPRDGVIDSARFIMGLAAMASYSDFAENKILNHSMGKESWTMPTTVAMALCTETPTDAKTGATIVEAGYTGYARKVIAASALSAASGGEIKNSEALTFAECTASSSVVQSFGICDSSTKGAGNLIAWGTVTSVTISTTQTPANVAANALVVTLD